MIMSTHSIFAWGTRSATVTILALAALFAATDIPAASASHAARVASIKAGGSLTYRMVGNPDCLDPQKTENANVGDIDIAILDTLVTIDPKGKLEPDLATKWTFGNGNKWITFTLRPGLKFSNGAPLDAAAVKASFDRIRAPATKAGISVGNIGSLKSEQVLSKNVIRFILSTPFRPLMTNLSLGYLGIVDAPAMNKLGSKSCQTPIGSGAFKVQSVGPGFNTITLVRNPLHTWSLPWAKNKGPAYLSTLLVKPIGDAVTATSDVLSGGVDFSDRIEGTQVSRLEGQSGIKVLKYPLQEEFYYSFNVSHPPFNSLTVRKAVAESTDRTAVIKALIGGQGVPAYSAVPPSLPYSNNAAGKKQVPPYDPAASRSTLAAKGVTGTYNMLTFQEAEGTTAGEFLQSEFAQVGLKTNVTTVPSNDLLVKAEQGQFDILFLGWGYADPDIMYLLWNSSQERHGGLYYLFRVFPTLDKLIVEGRSTLNTKLATKYYDEAQTFLNKNVLCVPLYDPQGFAVYRSNVGGYQQNKANQVVFQDLYVK
jgi:peptide/nickel transport system substrate-binding protein